MVTVLLTIAEVCKQLGIGDDIVRGAIADGRLVATRFGHRTVRVSQQAVDAYVLASQAKPEHQPTPATKPQPATRRKGKKKS